MIRFSVVIPTRNRHAFLRQAIASVRDQEHPAHEIIVVDDGEGAAGAVAGVSPRIVVLENHGRGPVAARNQGVAHASGEAIAFLDDDDWWTDCAYLAKVSAAFQVGADFCFGDGAMVFEDGRPELPYSFSADAVSLQSNNTILISAVTYRRALHDGLGRFDEALPYYWDWDWYLRVARDGYRLHHIDSPVVAVRIHAWNMSGESLETERRANLDAFAAKHGLPPIPLKNHLDIARHAPGIPPAIS